MKQEVNQFIKELNDLSEKINALANEPRIYNHGMAQFLEDAGNMCSCHAFFLEQAANQLGLQV